MPLSINVQLDIILYGFLSGILTGTMFDLYRIIRGIKVPNIIRIIQDILFWILTAMVVFCFLLYTNYAFLGVYVYIFMVVAIALYLRFISPFCIKAEIMFLTFTGKFIRVIFKNIMYPFKIIIYSIMGKGD